MPPNTTKAQHSGPAAHTPGPWTVYAPTAERFPAYTIRSPQARIARVEIGADNRAGADARLIAAAPELLEAVRALLCCLEYPRDTDANTREHCLAGAREAIAKAEGTNA